MKQLRITCFSIISEHILQSLEPVLEKTAKPTQVIFCVVLQNTISEVNIDRFFHIFVWFQKNMAIYMIFQTQKKMFFKSPVFFFQTKIQKKRVYIDLRNIPNIEPICIFGQTNRQYSQKPAQEIDLLEAYFTGFQGFWRYTAVRGQCGQVIIYFFSTLGYNLSYFIQNKKLKKN